MDATLSYVGTLQQTTSNSIVKKFGVTEEVSAKETGRNAVTYHGQSVQSGDGAPPRTTFDASIMQVRNDLGRGNVVTRVKLAIGDSSGVNVTTVYGKGNGVFDVVPEVSGSRWTNTAARKISAANLQRGSTLEDLYDLEGAYTEQAVPVAGLNASAQTWPDGNAVYQWPFDGADTNSSITYIPPRYGKLSVFFADAVIHQPVLIKLLSWYPSRPLALASDTTKNAGKVRIPVSCRVAPQFGTMATELDESVTRLDIIFGEYEKMSRTSYVAAAGLICLHVHDVLETHYDYNALAFSSKPLRTTTTDEVVGLSKGTGAIGPLASSAAAMPLDANIEASDTEVRLQNAVAIYNSLGKMSGRNQFNSVRSLSSRRIASIALSVGVAYPPAGKAIKTAVHVEALDANGNPIVGTYQTPIVLADSDKSGATKLSATSVSSSSAHIMLEYDGSRLSVARLTATVKGAWKGTAVFEPTPTTVENYTPPMIPFQKKQFEAGVSDLCIGPDGNIWATGADLGAISKIEPSGKFTVYPMFDVEPLGISVGSDKNLWFAEGNLQKLGRGYIGRITTSGTVTQYQIPVPSGVVSSPRWTAPGPDKRTWFTDWGTHGVGAIDMSGKIVQYTLRPSSEPQSIVTGPDGNMWITDIGLNAIDVMSTSGRLLAVHSIHTPRSGPWGITVGPDKNLWFAEFSASLIGRMTTSGKLAEFAVPTGRSGPLEIAAGPDGNVWFTESGGYFWDQFGKIGYISVDGKTSRDFLALPTGQVHDLVFDAHGNLWYSKFNIIFSNLDKLIY